MDSLAASFYVFRMRQRFGLLTKWEGLLVMTVRWLVFVAIALAFGVAGSLGMLALGASVQATSVIINDVFIATLGVYSLLLMRFYLRQKPTTRLPWIPPLLLTAYWGLFFIYPVARLVWAHI